MPLRSRATCNSDNARRQNYKSTPDRLRLGIACSSRIGRVRDVWAAQPRIATRQASARAVAVPAQHFPWRTGGISPLVSAETRGLTPPVRRCVAAELRPVDKPPAKVTVVFRWLIANQQRRVGDDFASVVLRADRVVANRCRQQRPFDGVRWTTGGEELFDVERQRIEEPRAGWGRQIKTSADRFGLAFDASREGEVGGRLDEIEDGSFRAVGVFDQRDDGLLDLLTPATRAITWPFGATFSIKT